jgi:hypothetical protein
MQPAKTAIVGCGVIRRLLIDHSAHYQSSAETDPATAGSNTRATERDRNANPTKPDANPTNCHHAAADFYCCAAERDAEIRVGNHSGC